MLVQWQVNGVGGSVERNHPPTLRYSSKGLPNISAYSMSKFAVRGLVQSLGEFNFPILENRVANALVAQELREHGICVNGYAPGTIQTDLGTYGRGFTLRSAVTWTLLIPF